MPQLPGLNDVLQHFVSVEWTHRSPEQIDWRLNDVSVTLLAYPFALDSQLHRWHGLYLADPRGIAVQKAYTLGRRARVRDCIDLHAVIKAQLMSLDEIMRRAQHIYGNAFLPRLFLQQLTYTRDLTDSDKDQAIGLLIEPQSFTTVEHEPQEMVQDWMKTIAPRQPRSHEGG